MYGCPQLLPHLHECVLPVNLTLMVLAQDLNLLAKLIDLRIREVYTRNMWQGRVQFMRERVISAAGRCRKEQPGSTSAQLSSRTGRPVMWRLHHT
jgi:hypothetical protein